MKILLFGDYSNCHNALGEALRTLGHDVTVASNGSHWMQTHRDIDISRPFRNPLGGLLLYNRLRHTLRPRLSGYDMVAINNPVMTQLRPGRCLKIFEQLRAQNGAVFLTAMGPDPTYIRASADPESPLRYNEWRIGTAPGPMMKAFPHAFKTWLSQPLVTLDNHVYKNVNGVASILYEYSVTAARAVEPRRLGYIGIPINTRAIRPMELPGNITKVRFMLGRHRDRQIEKGTDLLETAARAVCRRYPASAELIIVENQPYRHYLQLLRSAHVLLDQIYSYTPATNALLAMAHGIPAVSGGEDDFYRFIGEDTLRPVINAPLTVPLLEQCLENIIETRHTLWERGARSRQFVERHNDALTVARRALNFYTPRL